MKRFFTCWRSRGDRVASQALRLGPRPSRSFKKLSKAISVGDLEKVKEYVSFRKYDVNMQDREFRTPLHLACANGRSSVVSQLIDKKCKKNAWEREKICPFTETIQCKKEICATILLHYGADPNLMDSNGNTALHYAVCGEKISLVEKLLEYKANLEVQNKDGYTPLLLAITENNVKMVEFLLKRGANVNASDKNQRTALMIALIYEPEALVSLLLTQNVDLSCQDILVSRLKNMLLLMVLVCKYHQLISNYAKKKNAEKISKSKNTTFHNGLAAEELD
ncbi:LOW QUALITY PROTEIN: ankyrin repeat domain-containing protein 7 [Sorex fumeus]|uniref:LOW QUALITY PROTEIN: ankyrin repeat domain-containing protein 7 n=1 Tax=Sorex fumeus TaxID=62283 RepID=UPI0024AD85E7|nr:LOW QUALITY PROTEIN: ankyrin repeat domain-containing protein 7 [Sorex fumeus]